MQLGKLIQGFMRGTARGGARVTTGGAARMAGSRRMPNVKSTRTAAQRTGKPPAPAPGGGGDGGGFKLPVPLRMAGSLLNSPLTLPLMAAPFVAGARESFIQDQVQTGRGDSGQYDSGFLGLGKLGQTLQVLPDDDALDKRRTRYLSKEFAPTISKLERGGFTKEAQEALNPRLSDSEVGAALSAYIPEAEVNIEIAKADLEDASPRGQRALARERRAENLQNYQITESINMTRRQLEAGIDQASRQLSQSELALQLAGQQQERQQALDLYREQNRADERKYRDRLELMQGLSTLAMGAFS